MVKYKLKKVEHITNEGNACPKCGFIPITTTTEYAWLIEETADDVELASQEEDSPDGSKGYRKVKRIRKSKIVKIEDVKEKVR